MPTCVTVIKHNTNVQLVAYFADIWLRLASLKQSIYLYSFMVPTAPLFRGSRVSCTYSLVRFPVSFAHFLYVAFPISFPCGSTGFRVLFSVPRPLCCQSLWVIQPPSPDTKPETLGAHPVGHHAFRHMPMLTSHSGEVPRQPPIESFSCAYNLHDNTLQVTNRISF